MIKVTKEDQHFLRTVLSLSWLSGLIIVLAGLVVTGGAIITFSLNHSSFKQELLSWEQSHGAQTVSTTGQSLQAVSPTLSNSWPLILLWGAVGLGIYFIAASIVRDVMKAIQFERQLGYIHADPNSMVKSVIKHLIMRVVSIFLLVMLVILFVNHTLPYVITVSHISAANLWSLQGIHYAALSFALTAACTYAASILLRLSLGKQRVFSR
jgi:hypothetical protein